MASVATPGDPVMNGTAMAADPALPAALLRDALGLTQGADLWVFAYGSLIWEPGFVHCDRRPALLRGYHREFCVSSHVYRGTPEKPGLVLGLAPGGACRGIAYRIAAGDVPAAMAYLWAREMVHYVYRPRLLPVRVDRLGTIQACAFVADPGHEQYRGGLPLAEAAAIIATAAGRNGRNLDYLLNTVGHLGDCGISDRYLGSLLAAIEASMDGG